MNASDGNGTNPDENNPNLPKPNGQQKGKGRKKLAMEKIENETNRQVTFSKRRTGLLKKASELSTLCGAESAVVVFSPSEKAYSYGHPNVETIENRFLHTNVGPILPHHEAGNHRLNQELIRKEELLERERKQKSELNQMMSRPNINELNYEQLNQLQDSVLGFISALQSQLKDATSSEGGTNVQGLNLEQGASSSAHGAGGSYNSDSSVLIPYNSSNPGDEALFGDTDASTSDIETEDET